jgi:hypothetical protein
MMLDGFKADGDIDTCGREWYLGRASDFIAKVFSPVLCCCMRNSIRRYINTDNRARLQRKKMSPIALAGRNVEYIRVLAQLLRKTVAM